MNLPTARDIEKLKKQKGGLHISAYMPLDYTSPQSINANEIRRKNLASELEKSLKAEHGDKATNKLLKPLRDLSFSRSHLWQRETKCLAVFVNGKELIYYFLPIECDEQSITQSDHFLVKPLENILANNKTFYILSASYNHAQLYKGDNFGLWPINLKDLPTRGADVELGIDEYPKSLQYHASEPGSSRAGGRGSSQQFHGQYNPKEVEKNILMEYFRKVNRSVYDLLKHKSVPLIFAGVDYLFPIYKTVNSYRHLWPGSIEGNYQRAKLGELHKRALATIK